MAVKCASEEVQRLQADSRQADGRQADGSGGGQKSAAAKGKQGSPPSALQLPRHS